MDKDIKDIFQVISWGVASVGGTIAALLAIREAQKRTKQRQEELRWNRARLAMDVLDKLKSNSKAKQAMSMLDWEDIEYEIGFNQKATIWDKDVWLALRTDNTDTFTDTEVFIRECFDAFFDEIEKMETFVNTGLIEFSDIKYQIQYYVQNLIKKKKVYEVYLKEYRFNLAPYFLERFEVWRTHQQGVNN